MKRRNQVRYQNPKSPNRGGGGRRDMGIQCTAIATSTGKQCLKNVTDVYQITQKFPKCSIHAESCRNIYPKYKAACAIPINIIPDNPRQLSKFTTSELQDAAKDAKECTSLRKQYTSECFAGNTDEGHLEIIENVLRKSRMVDIEIRKRKSDEADAKKIGDSEKMMFRFRSRSPPTQKVSSNAMQHPSFLRSPSPRRR